MLSSLSLTLSLLSSLSLTLSLSSLTTSLSCRCRRCRRRCRRCRRFRYHCHQCWRFFHSVVVWMTITFLIKLFSSWKNFMEIFESWFKIRQNLEYFVRSCLSGSFLVAMPPLTFAKGVEDFVTRMTIDSIVAKISISRLILNLKSILQLSPHIRVSCWVINHRG